MLEVHREGEREHREARRREACGLVLNRNACINVLNHGFAIHLGNVVYLDGRQARSVEFVGKLVVEELEVYVHGASRLNILAVLYELYVVEQRVAIVVLSG